MKNHKIKHRGAKKKKKEYISIEYLFCSLVYGKFQCVEGSGASLFLIFEETFGWDKKECRSISLKAHTYHRERERDLEEGKIKYGVPKIARGDSEACENFRVFLVNSFFGLGDFLSW